MAGWHHWLDGHESEWTLGVGDGQGGLAWCNSWDRKESDTTQRLNWMVFPVVTYSCESWKKAGHQIIYAFELWYWSRLLKVPWIARSSNQSWGRSALNIHWTDWYWSWISSIFVIWWAQKTHWKIPDARKDWGQKKRASEDEMAGCHHRCNGHELGQTLGDGEGHRETWHAAVHGVANRNDWVTEWQQMKYSNALFWYMYFQVISKKTRMAFKMLPQCHLQKQKF